MSFSRNNSRRLLKPEDRKCSSLSRRNPLRFGEDRGQGSIFLLSGAGQKGGKPLLEILRFEGPIDFDNRYIVANLIACEKDTPRVVDPDIFRSVFDLQEKVIEDIL